MNEPAAPAVPPTAPSRLDALAGRLATVRVETILSVVIVVVSMAWILSTLHPRLIVADTTPTGGDMGAHVWSPAYLRDHLIPNGKLIGWTPDWYAGFPAFQFYMILPSLAIVLLNVGISPWLAVLTIGAALVGVALVFRRPSLARLRGLSLAVAALVAVLSIGMPYGVAFKMVVVSGLVTMPLSAFALGRLGGLAFPGPVLLSVATLPFVFDRSFNIYGGNIASTMAGEFAFSMALSLSLVAIGASIRALDTGRGRGWSALLLTLTGLCHLFPAFFALGVVGVYAAQRFGRTQLRTLAFVLPVGGALGSFWALPFLLKHTYMNDMGWGKLGNFKDNLLTRNTLPSSFLRDSPPLEVVFALAVVGLVLCLVRGNRLGVALGVAAAAVALAFIHRPEGRLWNGRMLPFYYLSLYFLAALALHEAVHLVRTKPWARWFTAYALVGLLLAELLRALVAGRGIETNVGRVLPGPDTHELGALLLAVLAGVLWWRYHRAGAALAAGAGLIWLGALTVDPRWWTTASGGRGILGVAGESVLRPSAYAVLHALEYPAAYVLFGMVLLGFVDLAVDTTRLVAERPAGLVRVLAGPVAFLGIFVVLAPPLRSVPFGSVKADGTYEWGLPLWKHRTRDVNFLPSWAKWNFEGYERKVPSASSGGYPEYYELLRMTERVGADPALGCGRAMWEYGARLEGYGTPMAPMLIPHYTDGCIGSMEGLYFEASSTTPHHFLNQSALSEKPSSPQRDLPYPGFDIDLGVAQLQMMGVRYYLAFTDKAVTAALAHPDLEQVGVAGVWHMFLVRDSDLVSPLTNEPVVYANVADTQDEWLQPAASFFVDRSRWDVLWAADGPSSWARVEIPEAAKLSSAERARERAAEGGDAAADAATIPEPERRPLPPVTVRNITSGRESLSFEVDRPGVPVLVKISYFPNWKVKGGEGPYRVTPNLMVVVPTSERVELTYGTTAVDHLGNALTVLGLIGLVVLFRRRPEEPSPPVFDPYGWAVAARTRTRGSGAAGAAEDARAWPPATIDPPPARPGPVPGAVPAVGTVHAAGDAVPDWSPPADPVR